MTEYHIKLNEVSVMVQSLRELFQELGDNVNPKILAERMALKTGRTYQYHQTSYLLRLFGFTTRKLAGRMEGWNNYYIVPDYDLLGKLEKESAQITERTKANQEDVSPYSRQAKRTDVNLFNSNLKVG
jgi:hypothetical protein